MPPRHRAIEHAGPATPPVQGMASPSAVGAAAVSFLPRDASPLQIDLGSDAFIAENTLEKDLVGRVQIGF